MPINWSTAVISSTRLTEGPLTIEAALEPDRPCIATGPRIGITRSADLPLRFWIAGNPFVSR